MLPAPLADDLRRYVEALARHFEERLVSVVLFGSWVRGATRPESDLDLLVDPVAGKTTLVSLVRIKRDIESLTGVTTDVLTPMALHERFRGAVLAEAVPL